ncbi:MAG: 8-oxo-dGTP diphosphatase [Bacteroidales bacterium]|nr:8-oxo-dGTP diphosphatase [Bacteroidales bacterium]
MRQTTLCYIDDGQRYLMLHRVKKANDASHEKWIGVGGKCEANESPDECMVREVREETGIEVTRWRYRGIVTFISNTWPNEYMHLFTATEWRGRVGDCDEGDLAWVDKKRLEELNLWQGDRLFLRLLLDDGAPFFSMKLVYVDDNLVEAKIDGHPVPLP